jgi:Skp family chaperone for outer membrane proteins
MKTLFTLFALLLLSIASHAAVIDPSNLAQNISQVIQSKLMSKIQGDAKEIANSQLKTENQTTADIIGMNSTEKLALIWKWQILIMRIILPI